jgi:two-component system response regulator NreC
VRAEGDLNSALSKLGQNEILPAIGAAQRYNNSLRATVSSRLFECFEGEPVCPHAQNREGSVVRCALVHSHVLLRQGLRRLLEDEAGIEVVAESGNSADALRQAFEHQPQVVLADVHVLRGEAEKFEQLILQESPRSKVIFISSDESGTSHSFLKRGHCALRQTAGTELIQMVRSAASDGSIRQEIRRGDVAEWPIHNITPRQRVLTARERQVLKLLAEGRTVRSTATFLGLSVKTVDAHKFNLMRKLGLHNKAELVMWAIQKKVLKLPANL